MPAVGVTIDWILIDASGAGLIGLGSVSPAYLNRWLSRCGSPCDGVLVSYLTDRICEGLHASFVRRGSKEILQTGSEGCPSRCEALHDPESHQYFSGPASSWLEGMEIWQLGTAELPRARREARHTYFGLATTVGRAGCGNCFGEWRIRWVAAYLERDEDG
jgi:hypothetical protein